MKVKSNVSLLVIGCNHTLTVFMFSLCWNTLFATVNTASRILLFVMKGSEFNWFSTKCFMSHHHLSADWQVFGDLMPVSLDLTWIEDGEDHWSKLKLFLLFMTLSHCNSAKSLQILPSLAKLQALLWLFLWLEMEEICFITYYNLYFGRNVPRV